MTASYDYDGNPLARVRRGSVSLTQAADKLQVGSGNLTYDDTPGTQAIIGQKDFAADESACSNPITFRGFVAPRELSRQSERKALAREDAVSVVDLNAMAGFRRLRVTGSMTKAEGGKRPAETVAQRGSWLMASPFVTGLFIDNGRCDFPADKGMDKADYRNQFPGDVLLDMALASLGYNTYIRDFGDGAELAFRDDNASTDDTIDVRVSNDIADVTGDITGLTFYPYRDAVLRRSPDEVISDLGLQYSRSTVNEERASTATAFNGERGGTASNANIKTAANASQEARAILHQRSTEEDVINCTILVPASAVNLVNHGDRMQARFTHLGNTGGRDYDAMTWFRVLEATKRPLLRPVGKYEVTLKLSPQEEGVPAASGARQSEFGRGTHFGFIMKMTNPITVGSKIVAFIGEKAGGGDPAAPNVTAGLPRFGAGAWTRFNGSQLTRASAISTPQNGCSAWWKVADSTEQECYFATNGGVVGVFELPSTFDPASATVTYDDLTTGGPQYTIGGAALAPSAGDFVAAIWLLGTVGTISDWSWDYANSYPWQSFNPNPNIAAGWTTGISKWAGGDGMSREAILPGTPWVVIAYAESDGAALAPTVTPGQSGHVFGAIALVIPG